MAFIMSAPLADSLYQSCLEIYNLFENRQTTASKVVNFIQLWQNLGPTELGNFYKFIDADAAPYKADLSSKLMIRELLSYLANTLYKLPNAIAPKGLANLFKLYLFIIETQSPLIPAVPTPPPLNGVDPFVASNIYGDDAMLPTLTSAQRNEFALPSFTIINTDQVA